jgi:LuxR family maltose regulon positive regulatory protein
VPREIKLHRPELRHGVLARPRLASRLRDTDTAVALVVAPPGYGKTTLLAQWTQSVERPYTWLTLTDEDNDGSALLTYLALALDALEPLEPRALAALAVSEADFATIRLPRLGNVLAHRTRPFVLVLDDVHVLRDPRSAAVLELLADQMPVGSRLALAGRNNPPLSLGRMRANGDLLRIGTDELAMNEDEARALLAHAGVDLDGPPLESLVTHVEGWPAGLYLAALALRDAADRVATAERFAGHDRIVAEYLRDEALRAVPDHLRAFLIRSSVLDSLSARVCDAVLERTDSAGILDEIEASNLFLVPLDRRGEWYRYHHLFRDMLRGELHHLDPALEAELHRQASAWWEQHGDIDAALDHARAADDIDRMAALIWCHGVGYLTRGRTETVTRWLEPFTPDQVAAHPPLALAAAWWSLIAGDTTSITHWASLAANAGADDSVLPDGTPLRAALLLLRALAGNEGLTRVKDEAAAAFALDRPESSFRPIALFLEGASLRLLGRPQLARDRLEDAGLLAGVLHPAIHVHCLSQLALLALEENALADAGARVDRAMQLIDRFALDERPAMALVYAAAALTHARRGRTADARGALKHGLWLLESLAGIGPCFVADAGLSFARTALLLGDIATAQMLVGEAARSLARQPDCGLLAERLQEVERMTDASAMPVGLSATPLTPAEMRVLRYLPTHLSFEAIAEELIVSRNTVKTQAIAAYRKLGVSSRAEAVEQARELGLLSV